MPDYPLAITGWPATVFTRAGSARCTRDISSTITRMTRLRSIKVTDHSLSWHGEAFFGRLLADRAHVVPLLDAFVVPGKLGGPTPVKYVLVMPWFDCGTVDDDLGASPPDTAGGKRWC